MGKNKRIKILVLGKTGMLGCTLFNYFKFLLSEKYEVYGTTREELNIGIVESKDIKKIIDKYSPDIIINCIGIINKHIDDTNILNILSVNSLFPHILKIFAERYNFRLIHISTDCVVDNDIYGCSKKLGEVKDSKYCVTIRTSLIGGELKRKDGLFEWFMSQPDDKEIKGYANIYWDGISTFQFAKFLDEVIIPNEKIHGVIDYRSKSNITKYNLLKLFSLIFKKESNIVPDYKIFKDRCNPNADYFCEKSYDQQLKEMKEWEERKKSFIS